MLLLLLLLANEQFVPSVQYRQILFLLSDYYRPDPWYKPPPISPDLPMLFYEDAPKMKDEKSPLREGVRSESPPVVKSLGFGSFSPPKKAYGGGGGSEGSGAHQNVIHFGTDFGDESPVRALYSTTAAPAHYPPR